MTVANQSVARDRSAIASSGEVLLDVKNLEKFFPHSRRAAVARGRECEGRERRELQHQAR